MQTGPSLLQRIPQVYAQMSRSQQRIADVISKNPETAAFYTIAELAKQANVSEATVTRFAAFLDYSGFPALSRELQEWVRTKLTTGERFRLSSTFENEQQPAVLQYLDEDLQNLMMLRDRIDLSVFERIVQRFQQARRIGIVCSRSAESLGLFLEFYLRTLQKDAQILTGDPRTVDLLPQFQADDLLFGIGFARYSQFTIDCLAYGRNKGIPTAAITDYPASPLAEWADEVLLTPAGIASHLDSFVAPLSLITALLRALTQQQPERVTATLRELEDVWANFGIYNESKKR